MTEVTKLINLTPHEIKIQSKYGDSNIPASGQVARVQQEPAVQIGIIGNDDGSCVPIAVVHPPIFGAVQWPDFDTKKYSGAIVSMLVGQAVRALPEDQRPEFAVFVPDTGPDSVIRDEEGRIEAVSRLVVYSWGARDMAED